MLESLADQKGGAARFYEGALRALADRTNPVGAEMTAYALRELIQEAPKGRRSPRRMVPSSVTCWTSSGQSGNRRPGGQEDRGLVDNCDPAVFAADQFLDDVDEGHLARRDRAQETLEAASTPPVGRARRTPSRPGSKNC